MTDRAAECNDRRLKIVEAEIQKWIDAFAADAYWFGEPPDNAARELAKAALFAADSSYHLRA